MSYDFRAKQIETTKIIASGGIGGSNAEGGPGLMIYSASVASNRSGGISDVNILDGVGEDVLLFVSGSANSRGSSDASLTLFGGDIVVSGTLYAEKMVVEVDEITTGSIWISGSLVVSQSAEIREGLTVNSAKEGDIENNFYLFDSAGNYLISASVGTPSIALGTQCEAVGPYASVGGGYQNYAAVGFSHVGGGMGNSGSGGKTFVGAGAGNVASDLSSAVVAGESNIASGRFSAVVAGFSNLASGDNTIIGCGQLNTASADYASVLGGHRNVASSQYSAVLGSSGSTVSGQGSFAIGTELTGTEANHIYIGGGGSDVYTTVISSSLTKIGGFKIGSDVIGSDTSAFISGSIGSKDSETDRGTAVFGGDVVISGTAYLTALGGLGSTLEITSSMVDIGWQPSDITNGLGPILRLSSHDAAIAAHTTLGQIEFWGADSTSNGVGAKIVGKATGNWNSGAGDYPTEIQFWTTDNGTSEAISERMVITGDGKVGINTTAPGVVLTVSGSTAADTIVKVQGSQKL